MGGGDLQALAAKLLVTLHALAGYPVSDRPPIVRLAPPGEIAAAGCAGGCNARGLYLPGEGVLLSEALDPLHEEEDRAVLLHELVHHAQDLAGRFADEPPCERFLLREQEAYAIENRYLQRRGLTPDPGMELLLQTWSLAACVAAIAGPRPAG